MKLVALESYRSSANCCMRQNNLNLYFLLMEATQEVCRTAQDICIESQQLRWQANQLRSESRKIRLQNQELKACYRQSKFCDDRGLKLA
jgi:hypothetical protein